MSERNASVPVRSAPSAPAHGLLLRRKCACGTHAPGGGECAECSKKRLGLQRKLSVGASNDLFELEADRVAEQVMSVPASPRGVRSPPRILRMANNADSHADTAPPSVDLALASSGSPLHPDLRQDMEQRFAHDFSRVRVHTGSTAEQSARDINARAFTFGYDIVFGAGQYAPGSHAGKRLLSHELVHVVQQSRGDSRIGVDEGWYSPDMQGGRRIFAHEPVNAPKQSGSVPWRIQRQPEGKGTAGTDAVESERVEKGQSKPGQSDSTPGDMDAMTAEGSQNQASQTPADTVTPGGHRAATAGVAACPDAPQKNVIVLACTAAPATAPPAKEKAELPTPSTARFGGDADRARFAKELAQCHAERVVDDEIAKRYRADVEQARKQAATEARTASEEAVKKAVEGLADRREIAKATARARIAARKSEAKRVADAEAAVKKQDVASVTTELARKFEDALATDYDNTIQGALTRYGRGWLNAMQHRLDAARKRITKEKNPKPKAGKGETPPAKSADVIASEIEAEMTDVRCDQNQWARQQIEDISHAWAVGRREQVDSETIKQTASYLSKFGPTYTPLAMVDIPADIQSEKGMAGVAPEMADFLTALKNDPKTASFKAGNYRGHGGGSWAGKGFSADLTLSTPLDQRGFWQHRAAVDFLMQIDATAKAMGARWRVLYNDFRVAEEVNAATGTRNVEFMGTSSATSINWHGPAPLILHFHLDLEIPQKPNPTPPTTQGPAP